MLNPKQIRKRGEAGKSTGGPIIMTENLGSPIKMELNIENLDENASHDGERTNFVEIIRPQKPMGAEEDAIPGDEGFL
jgi:hypothetical protein